MIILAFLLGGIVAIASAIAWRALQWLEDQRNHPMEITFSTAPDEPGLIFAKLDAEIQQMQAAIHQAKMAAGEPGMLNVHCMAAAHQAGAYGQPPHGPATLARLSPQRLASDLRSDWRPERN